MKAQSKNPEFILTNRDVIFEDEDLIAVAKPPGLPSQPTLDPKRHNLARAIEAYLRKTSDQVYVGQHHRLDLDTSGVIVFTKSRRANVETARQFREHLAQKTYLAITDALPKKLASAREWTIKNHLAEERGRKRMHAVRSGGDFAETFFRVLKHSKSSALIEAKPRTGRRHQIRVHLADSGAPIVGDALYGSKRKAARIMLHALRLEIAHPITGEKLILEAEPPPGF